MTQKFINFDESKLQSMVVPQMKKDDDIARADDAMRSIMETVQVAKEIAPLCPSGKFLFQTYLMFLSKVIKSRRRHKFRRCSKKYGSKTMEKIGRG